MRRYRLTHEIYTPSSIDAGIKAFVHLCRATAEHHNDDSVLTIAACDEALDPEILNYILALATQEILQ